MRKCVCGVAIDEGRAVCARCGALQQLGLSAGATEVEVKAAYKMLVKVWHPDRFQSDPKLAREAEKKLKAVNAAFVFLTEEQGGGGFKGGGFTGGVSGAGFGAGVGRRATAGRAKRRGTAPRPMGVRGPRGWKGGSGWKRGRGLVVLAVLVGIGVFLLRVADGYLADDPGVGRYYVGFKTRLSSDFERAREQTWEAVERKYRGVFGGGAGTLPAAAPAGGEMATAGPGDLGGGKRESAPKMQAGPVRLLPYVTVGMTRDEVVAAQGQPTSATEDKLMYGASELDLKDGKVVGWRVDGRSPLRVKLWPEGPVDTGLREFGVGSTKDEVLAVEGTPSWFSQDRFEYGSSVVIFRGGRVVAWKMGSVELRVER